MADDGSAQGGSEIADASNTNAVPTPPPHPLDGQWFMQADGKSYGPFTGHQLRDFARDGRLTRDTDVNRVGSDTWTRLARTMHSPWSSPLPSPCARTTQILRTEVSQRGGARRSSRSPIIYQRISLRWCLKAAEPRRNQPKSLCSCRSSSAASARFKWAGRQRHPDVHRLHRALVRPARLDHQYLVMDRCVPDGQRDERALSAADDGRSDHLTKLAVYPNTSRCPRLLLLARGEHHRLRNCKSFVPLEEADQGGLAGIIKIILGGGSRTCCRTNRLHSGVHSAPDRAACSGSHYRGCQDTPGLLAPRQDGMAKPMPLQQSILQSAW